MERIVTKSKSSKTGLDSVKSIIAVSSCKGGVGKSMVSVNLAYALSQLGFKVGIFDADIYGPSLPTMVKPEDVTVVENNYGNIRLLSPLIFHGVKLMSHGFVRKQSSVLRGPLVSNIVTELIKYTEWGELDYLIVDMPPGTGDISITLSQNINIKAAVIVSTPQKLSFIDVIKGIELFDKVNVPTVSFVENMAYFVCDSCTTKHYIFGKSHCKEMINRFGVLNSFEIPMTQSIIFYFLFIIYIL